ncbi:MAG: phosphatase PAP2 family protein [Planctomycetota bacterium]
MAEIRDVVPVHSSRLLMLRWPLILIGAGAIVHLAGADAPFVRWANPDVPDWRDPLAHWIQDWGTRAVLLTAFLALALGWLRGSFRRLRTPASVYVFAWVALEVVIGGLKRLTGRPRPVHPDGILESLRSLYERPDLKSFPSGHAAASMAGALVLATSVRSPLLRAAAFAYAAFVAWGRSVAGAHYPSDTLVGAGIGWALAALSLRLGAMNRLRIERWEIRGAARAIFVAALVLTFSWLLGSPAEVSTFSSGELRPDIRLHRPLGEVVLEPITGPAAALSALPDLKPQLLVWAAWFLVAATVLAWLARRRAILPLIGMTLWGGAVVALALSGRPLGDRIRGGDDWKVVDLQIHLGDPVDGRMGMEEGRARLASLGVDAIVPTWHGRWAPGRVTDAFEGELGIQGMEWAAGPPAEAPLHLLFFCGPGVAPPDLTGEKDWRRAIERVHAAGGLVFASHFWRGEVSEMPRLEELLAAGVDGVEVAGRSPEWRAEMRERQRSLRALAGEGRVVLADTDFHGRRGAATTLNLLHAPGEDWAADPDAAARAIWEGLRGERPLVAAALGDAAPPPAFRGALAPLWTGWTYLGELSPRRRGAWLLWLLAILGVTLVARRRR